MRAFLLLLLSTAAMFLAGACLAQDDAWRLSAYLDALNEAGWHIVYSSDLVTDAMQVSPGRDEPADAGALAELLSSYGLGLVDGPDRSLLVVATGARQPAPEPDTPSAPAEVPIPEIIVTAGVHRLDYANAVTHTYLGRELATRMPTVAEEAVRLTSRVPGTANGGVSSRTHVRGGEANEVLYLLDGLRLYEPFHLKDFQAIATTVNSMVIADMEFFTGAYPARYGDRMSGVVDIGLRSPAAGTETELALSFFNTALLSMGRFGPEDAGEWLVSARRGNLDLIVDTFGPEYGSPDYSDYLLRTGWEFGPLARITANMMFAKDKLSLADPDRGESAGADYRNEVYWLRWDAEWSKALSSETLLASTHIDNRRDGTLNLPGIASGSLSDEANFRVTEFRQDWRAVLSPNVMLRFGVDLRDMQARHNFRSERTIAAPFLSLPGIVPSATTDIRVAPSGSQYAAYSEVRWRPSAALVLDLGLRWDQQTYTTASDDRQVSPRIGLLFRRASGTEIRLGWGRYYQAQEINELQVSDGVERFLPAQRSEHLLLNIEQPLPFGIDLAITAWHKRFGSVRPRFENLFNALTLLPELQFDRTRIDVDKSEARGLDLVTSYGTASDDLFWWAGWSFGEVTDTTAEGSVKRSWDQTHTFKGGVSWRTGRWNFSAAFEAHTGWPKTELVENSPSAGDTGQPELSITPRNSLRYSEFHTLDLRVSRDFELARGDLTAFLEINNAYNRENPCCTEYSLGPAGELLAKSSNWLPLVPSLGVVWRF
jgi:outer membrane receptor protein involved in Fe transport